MRSMTLVVCLLAATPGVQAITLREALDLAAKQNPDVVLARYRAAERKAQADIAKTGYLPQLTARAGASYQTNNLQGIGLAGPGIPQRIGPYRVFDARPVLTQPVFDLSLLADIRASRERERAAQEDIAVQRERTLFGVAQLYLEALQAASQVSAAEARLRTAESILKQTQEKADSGTASVLDVTRATQDKEQQRTAVVAARRQAATLRTLLAAAIGMDEAAVPDVEPVPGVTASALTEEEAMREAAAGRPGFRVVAAQEREAIQLQKSAKYERLPRLGFEGNYGALGSSPAEAVSTYAVTGVLSIPIWTSGRIAAKEREAAEKLRQVQEERRRLQIAVRQEVRQGLIERDAAEDAKSSTSACTRAARESLELARLRFEAGMATNLDVTVALGNLAQAEDQEIRARYDALLARARLAWARGDVYRFFEAQ